MPGARVDGAARPSPARARIAPRRGDSWRAARRRTRSPARTSARCTRSAGAFGRTTRALAPSGSPTPARAGLPVPSPPRTPTAPSRAERDRSRGSGARRRQGGGGRDRARRAVRALLHRSRSPHRLGATRAALEAEPPLPEDELPLVNRLATLRRWTVSDCLPVDIYPNQHAVAANAWLTFGVGADGRTRSVRAVRVSRDASADAQERCIVDAVTRWEFPAPRVGGRVCMRVAGTGPRREVPPSQSGRTTTPSYATAGYTRPRDGRARVRSEAHQAAAHHCPEDRRLQVRGRSWGIRTGLRSWGRRIHRSRSLARWRRRSSPAAGYQAPIRRAVRPDLGDSADPVQVILARRQPRPPRLTTASTSSASPIVSSSRSFSLRVTNR